MEKVRTLDELQETLGSVVDDLSETDDAVLIERRGAPRAAIISIEEFRRLRQVDEQQRRQQAFAELERLRLEIADALSDLSEDERQQLVEEFSVEVDGRIAARFP